MRKIFVMLVMVFSVGLSFASQKIFIFHINGIDTNIVDARRNAEALDSTIGVQSNIIANNGRVDLLYNKINESATSNLYNQLKDVFRQKAIEKKDITIDDFVVAYLKANGLDYKIGTPDYDIVKAGIKDDYLKDKSFIGNNLDDIYNQFRDKTKQIALYKNVLSYLNVESGNSGNDKPYVLLIPHSQGNLYANELYEYATSTGNIPEDHLAIYGIANPASKMNGVINPTQNMLGCGNDSDLMHYTTAVNDFIINGLSFFSSIPPITNSPMAGNIHLNTCNDFNICHSLINAYLADSNVAMQIKKQINLFLISLKNAIIRNENTRFIYFDVAKYGAGQYVQLFSPTKKQLCDKNGCDGNYFSYLNTSYENYDMFNLYFIAFKDKLGSGEYLSLSPVGSSNEIFSNIFVGNHITSGEYFVFYCDTDAKCKSSVVTVNPVLIDMINYMSLSGVSPSKDFSNMMPELYINGQFILNKVLIN